MPIKIQITIIIQTRTTTVRTQKAIVMQRPIATVQVARTTQIAMLKGRDRGKGSVVVVMVVGAVGVALTVLSVVVDDGFSKMAMKSSLPLP